MRSTAGGKLSSRLYLWTYNANFCNFVMPHPIWLNLGPNTQFYHGLGVRGIFEESVYSIQTDIKQKAAVGPSTDILNTYLMARTMWDITLDPKDLTDEWLLGYHGPVGGPVVRQFMALIAGNVAPGWDGCFGSCNTVNAKFLPPIAVLEAGHFFAEGLAAVQGLPGPYAKRLRAAAVQVWDVVLLRWAELESFATESGLSWPFRTKENCLGLFTQTWDENHMVKTNEQDGAGRDLMCSGPCFRRMVLNLTVAPANATCDGECNTCGPKNDAQATDDHCHCMRWDLITLQGICNGYNGAANAGGVTVKGRYYPGCEV